MRHSRSARPLVAETRHTFHFSRWWDAFVALATEDPSNAIKVAYDFR
jgi:hypothetical protein